MKIAVFVVFSCLCICFVHSVKEQQWGNTLGRTLGIERVVKISELLKVKTDSFTFPKVNLSFDFVYFYFGFT